MSGDPRLEPLPIFVYGTLQRGEERAPLWPCQPVCIERATVAGRLLDLGPYPGLIPGDQQVLGELWHIAHEDLATTLTVLDKVEGFNQPGQSDWYVRGVIECRTEQARILQAYVYRYAQFSASSDARFVPPDDRGLVHWHRDRTELH